jgi:hypothetical protein
MDTLWINEVLFYIVYLSYSAWCFRKIRSNRPLLTANLSHPQSLWQKDLLQNDTFRKIAEAGTFLMAMLPLASSLLIFGVVPVCIALIISFLLFRLILPKLILKVVLWRHRRRWSQ